MKWLVSVGIPIWKRNSKDRPAAFRVIHLLDVLSKAWFRAVWSHVEHKPAPMVFGAFAHHRREEVAIINRIMQFRWAKVGLTLLAALFDQANAFNSVTWQALEGRAMRDYTNSDKHFLQLRNRQSLCVMGDAINHAGVFAAGTGTRQGVTPAAQQFAHTFQTIVRKFDREHWRKTFSSSDIHFSARIPS